MVMKEPWRLPGGGAETGCGAQMAGAVGGGQQEVDAGVLLAWLRPLSPPPPSTPSPLPREGHPQGPHGGGEPGTRPQGWHSDQAL